MNRSLIMALVITALLTGTTTCLAAGSDEWRYEITPYLLMAGMKGDVGLKGHTADLDLSFNDILDDLDGGFMGLFTADKNRWQLALEAVYMDLTDEGVSSVTGPRGVVSRNGELHVTNEMYIVQGTVGYQLINDPTTVYVFGAARYNKLKVDFDINVNFTPPVQTISRNESKTKEWTDAVVGMHFKHPMSDNTDLVGYVDVGAGGSDLTYQFMGGVNWEFSEGYSAKFGYRYLYWDYEKDNFVWDVKASGPYLGLGIQF